MQKPNLDAELKQVENQLTAMCQNIIQATIDHQKQEIAKEIEKQTQSLETLTSSPVIRLNVGGKKYTTTLATLTSFPESKLGKMFQGAIPIIKDEKGNYFIDRNGEYFAYILDFLRDKTQYLPTDQFKSKKVREEMQYFELIPPTAFNMNAWTWDTNKKSGVELSDDLMSVKKSGSTGSGVTYGTQIFESGVYKWKVKISNCVNSYWVSAGLVSEQEVPVSSGFSYSSTWGMSSYGNVYRMTGTGSGVKLLQGDVYEFEYDADSGEFKLEVPNRGVSLTTIVKAQSLRPYGYVWTLGDTLTLSFE